MLSTLLHFPGRLFHSPISGSRVAHLLRGCLAPVALAMILAGCDAGQSNVTPNATATAHGTGGLVTATSDAWTPLEQRALHLPTLAPGASCPVAQPRQVNRDFGAGIGPGPVYAAIGSSDGVLKYASAVLRGRHQWLGRQQGVVVHRCQVHRPRAGARASDRRAARAAF